MVKIDANFSKKGVSTRRGTKVRPASKGTLFEDFEYMGGVITSEMATLLPETKLYGERINGNVVRGTIGAL